MFAIIRRLAIVVGILFLLTLGGTFGYRWIEGWSWTDALYMTVITLSTVGFQEARPLTEVGRLFTVAIIVAGSGVALYLLSVIAQLLLDGRLTKTYLRERMAMRIRKKHDHVIVGGFGRFGQAVAEELIEVGRQVVVVDSNPAVAGVLEERGVAHVTASASSDEGLIEAGIHGASAIVAATPSDAENVFITLAARELNPAIRVHARYETEAAARRLVRAGADQVVSPFQMGGSRTAASILRPAVVDFLEILAPGGEAVDIEQVAVAEGSPLIGNRLSEVEAELSQLRIVAIRRGADPIEIAPTPSTEIRAGDLLLVIGDRSPLLELAARAASSEED